MLLEKIGGLENKRVEDTYITQKNVPEIFRENDIFSNGHFKSI